MSKIFALVILLICILNGCQTIREKASGPEFEKAKLIATHQSSAGTGGSSDLAGGHGRYRGRRRGQAQRDGVFGGEKSESRRNHAQGKRCQERGQQPGGKALILRNCTALPFP